MCNLDSIENCNTSSDWLSWQQSKLKFSFSAKVQPTGPLSHF